MYDSDLRKRNNTIMFFVSLILVAVSAFVLLKKFDFVFSTNDDTMLRSIASGNYTGTPDAHLVYIMYPLGLLLKGLYTLFPSVPWYDGFMCFVHFGCIFLITYRPARVFDRFINKLVASIVSFVLIMTIDASFIVMHQYTVLAAVCAAAGLMWTATYNFKTHNRVSGALIIILFLLSLWLRKQVFFLSLPLLLGAVVFRVFESNETSNERFYRLKDALTPAIIFAVLVAVSFGIEAIAYSSPTWKAFKAYNEARTEVYDYNNLPEYDYNEEVYHNLGLDEKDHTLLREYDAALVDNMNTDTYKALSNRAKAEKKEWQQYYSVPRKVIRDTAGAIMNKHTTLAGIAVTVVFVSVFFFMFYKDEKLAGLIICATLVYEVAFTGYFMYRERLPERVTYGFYLMEISLILSIFLMVIIKDRYTSVSPMWQALAAIFVGVLIFLAGYHSLRGALVDDEILADKATEWMEVNAYFKSNPDNVYVLNTQSYAAMPAFMFNDKASEAFNLIKPGNWTLNSTLEEKHEARLISRPLKEALLKDDNVYFVAKTTDGLEEWLVDIFGQATFKDEFITGNGNSYSVYSLK